MASDEVTNNSSDEPIVLDQSDDKSWDALDPEADVEQNVNNPDRSNTPNRDHEYAVGAFHEEAELIDIDQTNRATSLPTGSTIVNEDETPPKQSESIKAITTAAGTVRTSSDPPNQDQATEKKKGWGRNLNYRCTRCSMAFDRQGNLDRHNKAYKGGNLLRCPDCDLTFCIDKALTMHTCSAKSGKKHFHKGRDDAATGVKDKAGLGEGQSLPGLGGVQVAAAGQSGETTSDAEGAGESWDVEEINGHRVYILWRVPSMGIAPMPDTGEVVNRLTGNAEGRTLAELAELQRWFTAMGAPENAEEVRRILEGDTRDPDVFRPAPWKGG